MLDGFAQALVQGVLLGGYYAIIAAGLSLMVGVVRFVNLAHGDMAVLGAFVTIALTQVAGLPLAWAIAASVLLMAGFGWLLHGVLFARAMRGGFLLPILVTIGLGAALQNGMFGIWGSNTRSLGADIGALAWSSWSLPGGIIIGKLPAIIFAVAVLVIAALHLMLKKTRLGRAIRATASDPEAAEMSGVSARQAQKASTAIAVALAALAGVLLAMRGQITPYSGPAQLIFAFEALVIGGIGSLGGTLIGGIVLGISQSLGGLISPQLSLLSGHIVFLAVLTWRLSQSFARDHGGWRASLAAGAHRLRGKAGPPAQIDRGASG